MRSLVYRMHKRGAGNDVVNAPRLQVPDEMPLLAGIRGMLFHKLFGAILAEGACPGVDGLLHTRSLHRLGNRQERDLGRIASAISARLGHFSGNARILLGNCHYSVSLLSRL